jgi:hypothetical protein
MSDLTPEQRQLFLRRLNQLNKERVDNAPLSAFQGKRDQAELPLSFAQQRLWFIDQLVPMQSTYHIPVFIALTGTLQVKQLEKTCMEMMNRHEVLRTKLALVNGEPKQIIYDCPEVSIPLIDISHIQDESQKETEAGKLATEESRQAFSLAADFPIRFRLIRLDDHKHYFCITLHHIAADTWSMGILIHELSTIYHAFTSGKKHTLTPLPIQYADFAAYQRNWLQGERMGTQLTYWKTQLSELPMLHLPLDRPRPAVPAFQGARQNISFADDVYERLKKLCLEEKATVFMGVLSCFNVLLKQYSRQEDIVVGTPVANRTRPELEKMIGFFVNMLVMRTDLSGDPTFRELLARVKKVALEAYAHQDIPFETLVNELHPERDLSKNPLFQVSIVLQNTPQQTLAVEGLELELRDSDLSSTTSWSGENSSKKLKRLSLESGRALLSRASPFSGPFAA